MDTSTLSQPAKQKGPRKLKGPHISPRPPERYAAIKEILEKDGSSISSAQQLKNALDRKGTIIAESTLAKDVEKVCSKNDAGVLVFVGPKDTTAEEDEKTPVRRRFVSRNTFEVVRVSHVLAVRTVLGTGSGVAYRLKKLFPDRILGTIADDNMVLVVVKEDTDPDALYDEIQAITRKNKMDNKD